MKCYYHNDLDGRCAGAIVLRRYPACEMIEVSYKDEIDIDAIKLKETIYIVDFSFKPEIMGRVLKRTKDIVWIDHHKTAFEYIYSEEIKGLRNNEFSGCELAWQYFDDSKMPYFVRLIGDYDKWAWKLGEDTANFKEGVRLYKHQPHNEIWKQLFNDETMTSILIKNGKMCLQYRDEICADYIRHYGFETEFEGHKAFACGFYQFGSDKYGDKINQYPLLLSFEFDGEKYTVGLYSTKIDVSEIAKKYNGGGHRGAAGFICKELPFRKLGGKYEAD